MVAGNGAEIVALAAVASAFAAGRHRYLAQEEVKMRHSLAPASGVYVLELAVLLESSSAAVLEEQLRLSSPFLLPIC